MNNLFFSVIIPVFKRRDVLVRAVKSVLAQTYPHFEILIINDGSGESYKDLEKLSPFIRVIEYEENRGVSFARNLGVNESQYSWLAFLDSDDEWEKYKLQIQYDYLKEHEDCEILHGEEIWIRKGVRVNPKKKHQKSGGNIFLSSLELCLMSPSATVMKKSLFKKMGQFREDYPCCEDYDLWLKITSHREVGFIETPIIKKYGGHEDQLSHKYKAMDYFRIKTLFWLWKHQSLNTEQQETLKKVFLFKANILLKGYKKHQNLTHYSEVKDMVDYFAR